MKRFTQIALMLVVAVTIPLMGCTKLPNNVDPLDLPEDPKIPTVVVHGPWEAEVGSTVEIRATATVEDGTIASVTLTVYEEVEDGIIIPSVTHTIDMSPTDIDNEYQGSFTAPLVDGEQVAYSVKAVTDAEKSAETKPVILTAKETGTVIDDNAAKKLRLTEISTYGNYKFIEIFNPVGLEAVLEDVSLWKNGELLHSFNSTHKLAPSTYGVFRAKGASFTVPASAVTLGETVIGLSGSKSLSIELRYKDEVIDAFANTVNPGVADMTTGDWDDEVENPAGNYCDFFRKDDLVGWYAIGGNSIGSPGKVTLSGDAARGERLKHQLMEGDAVADVPYFDQVTINPDRGTSPVGLTSSNNVIRFRVFSDVHNPDVSVSCAIDGANAPVSHIGGVVYEITPSLSGGTAAGTAKTLKISVTNDTGSYPASSDKGMELLVFPDGQTFGKWEDIRLNEIRTTDGDAIELYNTSTYPVVIAGMRIRKDKDRIFTVPGYMVMKANGFAVLGCDDDVYAGGSYLALGTVSNGLSGTKALLLELRRPKLADDPDGANGTNIDSFVNTTIAAPNKDNWDNNAGVEKPIPVAAGRKTDGSGDWYTFSAASIGASNSGSTVTTTRFTRTYSQAGGSDE